MPAKCKVVGLWPRFYVTIWLLCHRSREHIFVISQEATTSIFFSVTSRGCKLLASWAMTTHNNLVFMLYRNEWTTIIQFFHRIAWASKQAMTTWYRKEWTSARRFAMSEWFYCHSREKRSIFYTSYRKKQPAYFLRHIPKGNDVIACESMSIIAKTRQYNIFWCCGKQSYCRGATTVIQPSRDARTQQNFSCCPS